MKTTKTKKTKIPKIVCCHAGEKEAFKDPISGITFSGGAFYDLDIPQDITALSLNGGVLTPIVTNYQTNVFDCLRVPTIQINWVDGGVPAIDIKGWKNILSELRRIGKNVIVFCTGGHGRTGTALAILSVLCGVVGKDENPIEFVRKNHCKEAVETEDQVEYIAEITGCDAFSIPSMYFHKNLVEGLFFSGEEF